MSRRPSKPIDFETHPVGYEAALDRGLFRAVCYHVVDGDTADFLLDLGFYQYSYITFRFYGINTAEVRGTSGEVRALALRAKARVEELALKQPVLARSYKEKTTFGRFVANIWVVEHPSINPELPNKLFELADGSSIRFYSLLDILIDEELGEDLR